MSKRAMGLILTVFLGGCAPTCVMDTCDYASIYVGESIDEVTRCAGAPYEVCRCGDGRKKYVFIDHEEMAPHDYQVRRYIVIVEDGQVVDKWCEQEEVDEYRPLLQEEKDEDW